MSTDFEQRLRDGLASRASQVTPDPGTWTRVQEGIRRGRRFRWVYAGAAVAAIAALAVVLPGVLTSPDVGFEEGPLADQPDEGPPVDGDVVPAPAEVEPPPVDVVLLAEEIGIVGPDTSHTLGAGEDFEDVAVAPGSTPEALDVVVAGRCGLTHISADAGGSTSVAVTDDGASCAQGPRFSPDGEQLAWIERHDGGTWALRTVGWDGGPVFDGGGSWDIDLRQLDVPDVDEVDSVRIIEWARHTGDVLHLTARDGVGAHRVFTLHLGGADDGAPALGSDPDSDRTMLAYQSTAAAAWSVELLSAGVVEIVRSDDGEQLGTLPLPSEVVDPETAETARVWFEVSDEVVVLGDGDGRAWWTRWDGAAFDPLTPIAPGLATRHGAILTPAASAPADDVEQETEREDEALAQAEVEATRAALQAAAASGDLENLRPLLPDDGFTHTYSVDEDPIAYWREREAEGEDILGLIERLLSLPPVAVGEDTGMWVWPFAYDRAYESLSSAEHIALEEAIGPDGMAFYAETNEYLYYRIGIDADGTWRFLVAGD